MEVSSHDSDVVFDEDVDRQELNHEPSPHDGVGAGDRPYLAPELHDDVIMDIISSVEDLYVPWLVYASNDVNEVPSSVVPFEYDVYSVVNESLLVMLDAGTVKASSEWQWRLDGPINLQKSFVIIVEFALNEAPGDDDR